MHAAEGVPSVGEGGGTITDPERIEEIRGQGTVIQKRRHETGAWLVSYMLGDEHYHAWVRRPGGKLFDVRRIEAARPETPFDRRFELEGPPSTSIPLASDNQRRKIYDWEQDVLEFDLRAENVAVLDQDELHELAETAFHLFNVPDRPTVEITADVPAAVTIAPGTIKLPRNLAKPYVLMHQCAHLIANDRPEHGPQFVSVYLDLLSEVLGQLRPVLERSARLRDIYVERSLLDIA